MKIGTAMQWLFEFDGGFIGNRKNGRLNQGIGVLVNLMLRRNVGKWRTEKRVNKIKTFIRKEFK